MGVIRAVFQSVGCIPEVKDLLNNLVTAGAIADAVDLSIVPEIAS